MKGFRSLAGLVGWFALLLQYYLIMQGQGGPPFAARTVNYFSYFTILSNLLAAIGFSAPLAAAGSPLGRMFARPAVRTAITLYMSVTAATYIVVLQGLWRPEGLQWVADVTLHYVMPALVLADWLLFTPKGGLRWSSVLPWLVFPLLYGVYSIVRGPLAGFYPYPFLNIANLGLPQVLINMAAVTAVFVGFGLALVLLDGLMKRRPV